MRGDKEKGKGAIGVLFSMRLCPVCLGRERQVLFHQTFSMYSEGGLMDGYDLVVCDHCGAAFADHIPVQDVFDKYYASMSKYEHGDRGGAVSAEDVKINRQIADSLMPYVKPTESLVDIGCATGALLAEFKGRNFQNVLGFDPSPACCNAARRLYDIDVRPMTIARLDEVVERFDVVMLTGVMEHLCDVESSVIRILNLLKPGGRLYLAVPDASQYQNWFSAPYQFFSMEHVNFFAPRSLSNLMIRHGMKTVFIQRVARYLGPNSVEPVLFGLFQRSDEPTAAKLEYDTETEPALRDYIAASSRLDGRITSVISQLVDTQVPLVVWGTGTHTLRLLDTSSLAKANILAFIDSNSRYQGKRLLDIPIIAPKDWRDPSTTILISSHVAEQEIKNHIVTTLGWKNPVICLYEGSPLESGSTQGIQA